MKVVFFDDDDDDGRWDVELDSPPREGERVILPNRTIGTVMRVTWGLDGPYVEVIVKQGQVVRVPSQR